MNLSDLHEGDKGIILKVRGRGAFRKRILEMGFVVGKEIAVIKRAPLKDPIEYSIMGYNVSLRESEAQLIEVVNFDEFSEERSSNYEGVIDNEGQKFSSNGHHSKVINVVLVGNPNSGKTTLFNYASGSKEHVGNYSGVTVDAKEAKFKHGEYTIKIVDLPGTYSLTAFSPEEIYVREYILRTMPDVVVNIIDASNLERNLFLTTQLIDMDIKVVIALNMFDEFEKKGDVLNQCALGKLLGIPIVPTVSSRRKGILMLFEKVVEVFEDHDSVVRHIHINYGESIENAIRAIQDKIKIQENVELTDIVSSRFLAIKLIERDKEINKFTNQCSNHTDILSTTNKELLKLEKQFHENSDTLIVDAKYGFINGALKETLIAGKSSERKNTEIIDTFLTHRLFGFPVFLAIMWLIFTATFSLGAYPASWIDQAFHFFATIVGSTMQDGTLKDLIINGIISGVGGVVVYLPTILLLFFFISLMEDTGYMARTVFIMDKLMHKIGLHGKSFIPMVMGFGCNVPAIMATRTIENKNERLLTILINPFMSCSARLPVYVLFIGAFFANYSGTVLFSVYFTGIAMAVLVALLFKRVLFKADEVPFVMELPPYRVPTLRSIILHMWNKGSQYLKKITGIILLASILIWALNFYPRKVNYSQNFDQTISDLNSKQSFINADESISKLKKEKLIHIIDSTKFALQLTKHSEKQEQSYIAQFGRFVSPILVPLGMDWKMGVALITGVAAKEIVVGTLGVLYHVEMNSENSDVSLTKKIKTQTYKTGEKKGENVFNPSVALAFMIFVLLYSPCMGTLAVIKKETGTWKWAAFILFYTTTIAWAMSFIVYTVSKLFLL